jgi:superfamily II DNA helicase RecQ
MEANIAASDKTEKDEEEANKGEETEDSGNEQEYKVNISKYSMILKVHTKLTVKTTKRGQGAAKLSDKLFNALPWYGLERHLQNQSIEPKIDNLWNALFAEVTSTPLQTLMIKVNENKATTPVTKKMTIRQFFDELSLKSGALDAAGTNALDILDRLEVHVEESRDMKAEKRINIPVNVIEKVASMVDQVKDLQQKIDEANNNICRLKYQFMGEKK